MGNLDKFSRGEVVIITEKVKGKKENFIGTGKVVTCEKSSINYSTNYIPWNPLITVVEVDGTGELISNAPYTTKYNFYHRNDYIKFLKDEKKQLLDEVREIDELIKDLEEK